MMEPADQFYGDRNAGVKDPCGNLWWIATHIEDVPPEELARRAAQMKPPKE
jgi:PhnB protein